MRGMGSWLVGSLDDVWLRVLRAQGLCGRSGSFHLRQPFDGLKEWSRKKETKPRKGSVCACCSGTRVRRGHSDEV